MNAPLTRAADGLPRRAFTNAEIARMVEAGVIDPDESFELIKGEIVPRSPEFDKHPYARMTLVRRVMARLGAEYLVATEGSFFLADDIEFKPDLHVFAASLLVEDVRGPDVLLAVEIAWSSRNRDLHLKAPLYAAHGVRELWVFDLDARVTHVLRDPAAEGYREHRELDAAAVVEAQLLSGVQVALNDLLRP
jgi:Uma2 family endonuclease